MESNKVLTACNGKVLVSDIDYGEQVTESGIVIQSDDGKLRGIRSRWAKVYSVGSDITDIKEGEWVLVAHGRWSRTIELDGIKMNLIDYPKGVLCAAPKKPDNYVGFGK